MIKLILSFHLEVCYWFIKGSWQENLVFFYLKACKTQIFPIADTNDKGNYCLAVSAILFNKSEAYAFYW